MKVLHIVPAFNEANGVFVVARMLAGEGGGRVIDAHAVSRADIAAADEVWVHGMWLPCEWRACRLALKAGKRLVRMTHGSLSPVYLERQGKWKKRLVAPIERHYFAKCDRIIVTGAWEEEWCQKWGVKGPFETVDLKKFFSLKFEVQSSKLGSQGGGLSDCCSRVGGVTDKSNTQTLKHSNNEPLHLLYLGRRHPLKGLEYLEEAVRSLKFKVQSSKSGCRGEGLSDCMIDRLSDCCSRAGESNNQTIKQSNNELVQSDNKLTTHNLQLKIVSSAFGEELEKIWSWCDVLVLPTLSDNFGLVIAEALERGKCVITTDGAPAWGEGLEFRVGSGGVEELSVGSGGVGSEIWAGYGGRLVYLKGYREGTKEQRIKLLRRAIELMSVGEMMAVS